MIYREVHIEGAEWTAHFYFAIDTYWESEILARLRAMGASRQVTSKIARSMHDNKLDTGFTYSKPAKRESIVVVGRASNGGEFLNSTTHEIRHLVDDIAKTDAMPMCGEGVAYLTGDIINEIADIVCKFSCDCCRKKAHFHKKS